MFFYYIYLLMTKALKDGYPFKAIFSLIPLIKFWNKIEKSGYPIDAEYARRINEELKNAPELFVPIENNSVLQKHRQLIESMLNAVFSPASKEYDFYAAVDILSFQSFYETKRFRSLELFKDSKALYNLMIDTNTMQACTVIGGYAKILGEFYNINLNYE